MPQSPTSTTLSPTADREHNSPRRVRTLLTLTVVAAATTAASAQWNNVPVPVALTERYNAPGGQVTGRRNVAVIVHGYTSSPDDWSTNFRASLLDRLGDDAANWDVWAVDWRQMADAPGQPLIPPAANLIQAQLTGQSVAHRLSEHAYENVHLYGHSLGGRVIESAANALRQFGDTTIHQTFFDAYTPRGWQHEYGEHARFAEHVYNRDFAINTQSPFRFAHNIDVTNIRPGRPGDFPPDSDWPHGWPWYFYKQTIESTATPPIRFGLGHPRSPEAGAEPLPQNWRGTLTTFRANGSIGPRTQAVRQRDDITLRLDLGDEDVIRRLSDPSRVTIADNTLTLQSGFGIAVWVNLAMDLEDETNYFAFDYAYGDEGFDGLLHVLVNGSHLTTFSKPFAPSGELESGRIMWNGGYNLFGDFVPGDYTLSLFWQSFSEGPIDASVWNIRGGLLAAPTPGTVVALCLFGIVATRRRRQPG